MGVAWVTWPNFQILGPPYNFWTNRDIRFKFGTDIEPEDGPLLRPDHKTTHKWTWPGSRDQISKFWDPPYNSFERIDIRFKFGTDIARGRTPTQLVGESPDVIGICAPAAPPFMLRIGTHSLNPIAISPKP